jgi:hypothetical protein
MSILEGVPVFLSNAFGAPVVEWLNGASWVPLLGAHASAESSDMDYDDEAEREVLIVTRTVSIIFSSAPAGLIVGGKMKVGTVIYGVRTVDDDTAHGLFNYGLERTPTRSFTSDRGRTR